MDGRRFVPLTTSRSRGSRQEVFLRARYMCRDLVMEFAEKLPRLGR